MSISFKLNSDDDFLKITTIKTTKSNGSNDEINDILQ